MQELLRGEVSHTLVYSCLLAMDGKRLSHVLICVWSAGLDAPLFVWVFSSWLLLVYLLSS